MEEKHKIWKYILFLTISIVIILLLVLILPLLNEIAFEGSKDIEPYTEEELFDMGIEEGMWITKKENPFIVKLRMWITKKKIIVDKEGNPIRELNQE